jgi:hypothetical protein
MKLPRRQFLRLAAGAAALIAPTAVTLAQDWPTRPVTMVVPYAAGEEWMPWPALWRRASASIWASQ